MDNPNVNMFRLSVLFLIGNCLFTWAQPPRIGGYNVYYGSLHNHCGASDGTGTPYDAYNTAKNISGLDFFALSDHAEYMSQNEWNEIRNTADNFNETGVFAAFWGFEWSSPQYGHLTVTGSDEYSSCISPGTFTLIEINQWLDKHDCVAFFNHPGDFNSMDLEFNHFNSEPSLNIVGMELWNGTKGFERYYYNDGYYENDGGLGYYDEMLSRGIKAGATGACDTHGSSWGSGNYRMAVLSESLSRESLTEAFRNRRFYSTLDKNLAMSFQIQGREMGSILVPGFYSGEIRLQDADQEIFTEVELFCNGQIIHTFSINNTDPSVTFDVDAQLSDYYYIVVKQEDGDQAISSPIFIENESVYTAAADVLGDTDAIVVNYAADGSIDIQLTEGIKSGSIVITDIYGRMVYSGHFETNETARILLPDISPGIYFLFIPEHPEYSGYKIVLW